MKMPSRMTKLYLMLFIACLLSCVFADRYINHVEWGATNTILDISSPEPKYVFTMNIRCPPQADPTTDCVEGEVAAWVVDYVEIMIGYRAFKLKNLNGAVYNAKTWEKDVTPDPQSQVGISGGGVVTDHSELKGRRFTGWFTWSTDPLFLRLELTYEQVIDYEQYIPVLPYTATHNRVFIILDPIPETLSSDIDTYNELSSDIDTYNTLSSYWTKQYWTEMNIPVAIVSNTHEYYKNIVYNQGCTPHGSVSLEMTFPTGLPEYHHDIKYQNGIYSYNRVIDISLSGPLSALEYDKGIYDEFIPQSIIKENITTGVNCWIDGIPVMAGRVVTTDQRHDIDTSSYDHKNSSILRIWPERVLYQTGDTAMTYAGFHSGNDHIDSNNKYYGTIHYSILSSSFTLTCSDKYHFKVQSYSQAVEEQERRKSVDKGNDNSTNSNDTGSTDSSVAIIDRDTLNPYWNVAFGIVLDTKSTVQYIQYQPERIPLFDYNITPQPFTKPLSSLNSSAGVSTSSYPGSYEWNKPILPVEIYNPINHVYNNINLYDVHTETNTQSFMFNIVVQPRAFVSVLSSSSSSLSSLSQTSNNIQDNGILRFKTSISLLPPTEGLKYTPTQGDYIIMKVTPFLDEAISKAHTTGMNDPKHDQRKKNLHPSQYGILSEYRNRIQSYIYRYNIIPDNGTKSIDLDYNDIINSIYAYLKDEKDQTFSLLEVMEWILDNMSYTISITYIYKHKINPDTFISQKWTPIADGSNGVPKMENTAPRTCGIKVTYTAQYNDKEIIQSNTFYKRTYFERKIKQAKDDEQVVNLDKKVHIVPLGGPTSEQRRANYTSTISFEVGNDMEEPVFYGKTIIQDGRPFFWLAGDAEQRHVTQTHNDSITWYDHINTYFSKTSTKANPFNKGILGYDIIHSHITPTIIFDVIDTIVLFNTYNRSFTSSISFYSYKSKDDYNKMYKPQHTLLYNEAQYTIHNNKIIIKLVGKYDNIDQGIYYNAVGFDLYTIIYGSSSSVPHYKDYTQQIVTNTGDSILDVQNMGGNTTNQIITGGNFIPDMTLPMYWKVYDTVTAKLTLQYGKYSSNNIDNDQYNVSNFMYSSLYYFYHPNFDKVFPPTIIIHSSNNPNNGINISSTINNYETIPTLIVSSGSNKVYKDSYIMIYSPNEWIDKPLSRLVIITTICIVGLIAGIGYFIIRKRKSISKNGDNQDQQPSVVLDQYDKGVYHRIQ